METQQTPIPPPPLRILIYPRQALPPEPKEVPGRAVPREGRLRGGREGLACTGPKPGTSTSTMTQIRRFESAPWPRGSSCTCSGQRLRPMAERLRQSPGTEEEVGGPRCSPGTMIPLQGASPLRFESETTRESPGLPGCHPGGKGEVAQQQREQGHQGQDPCRSNDLGVRAHIVHSDGVLGIVDGALTLQLLRKLDQLIPASPAARNSKGSLQTTRPDEDSCVPLPHSFGTAGEAGGDGGRLPTSSAALAAPQASACGCLLLPLRPGAESPPTQGRRQSSRCCTSSQKGG